MKRIWGVGLAVMLWVGGGVFAAQEVLEVPSVQGGLDAGGGRGQSGAFVLIAGSLGQPFQTGELASSQYRLAAGFLQPARAPSAGLTGDFNGDDAVDFADFVLFAGGFGKLRGEAGYDSRLDLDGDGAVGFGDFVRFAKVFGTRR